MTRGQFARLCGVDVRTVMRWESKDGPRPKGASEAVLSAIREQLSSDPKRADRVAKFLLKAAAVGGLAYVLVKLLGSVANEKEQT
jgi:hypothetical protein